MTQHEISVAANFTPYPTGRYRKFGDGSGEEFRDDHLIPALNSFGLVIVDLDGARGYPASFLEEAFGGLIRAGIPYDDVNSKLIIKASDRFAAYKQLIQKYLLEASRRQA